MARTRDRDDLDLVEARPRSDAYTGMLAVSLVALLVGCVLLYMDYSSYPSKKPDLPPGAVKAGAGAGAQQPGRK